MPETGSNVTPLGTVPDSDRLGVGDPVAVTVNEPGAATVNAAEAALVMVGATSAENVAVTDCGASRRRFWGLVSPLRSPVNPVNWNPAAAVAAIGTVVPASNQPPAVMLPPFCGAVAVVSRYWVVYAP